MNLRLRSISKYVFYAAAMVTDFIQRVRSAVKQPGVTARGLAQKAGLHRMTLCNIARDDWNPTANVLKALEPHIEAIERGEWENPPTDSDAEEAADAA